LEIDCASRNRVEQFCSTLNGSAARGDRFHITILQCKIGFVFLVRCHTLASIG
jgi:hypothetical protein